MTEPGSYFLHVLLILLVEMTEPGSYFLHVLFIILVEMTEPGSYFLHVFLILLVLKYKMCKQDTVVLWSNSSCIRSGGWLFESRRCLILLVETIEKPKNKEQSVQRRGTLRGTKIGPKSIIIKTWHFENSYLILIVQMFRIS